MSRDVGKIIRMNTIPRRAFIKLALAGGIAAAGVSRGVRSLYGSTRNSTNVRIESISMHFEELALCRPFKFADAVVTWQTTSLVTCTVRAAAGKERSGFGMLPLKCTFAFPSKTLSPEARLLAMKALAQELVKVARDYQEFGHPFDLYWELAPAYDQAAVEVSRRLQLANPIPKLGTLVTAAAVDPITDAENTTPRLCMCVCY